jgi:hypothetical protein
MNTGTFLRTSNYRPFNASNSVEEFQQEALRRARSMYLPDRTGRLFFELHGECAADTATALISEHRPAECRQYTLELQRGKRAFLELPAGGYTIVARAPGFDPHRVYVDLPQGQDLGVIARIEPSVAKPPTFAQRLQQFDIDLTQIKTGNLVVDAGMQLTLTPETAAAIFFKNLTITSIDDAKRILGHPDKIWPGDQPRYGKMVGPPTGLRARDKMNMLIESRFAMQEYVYGNSRSVVQWKDQLNEIIRVSAVNFPVFVSYTVTVGPDAVLALGSLGLVCDTLRVHYTGKVTVSGTGPTVINVGTYEQYGWYNIPLTTPVHF